MFFEIPPELVEQVTTALVGEVAETTDIADRLAGQVITTPVDDLSEYAVIEEFGAQPEPQAEVIEAGAEKVVDTAKSYDMADIQLTSYPDLPVSAEVQADMNSNATGALWALAEMQSGDGAPVLANSLANLVHNGNDADAAFVYDLMTILERENGGRFLAGQFDEVLEAIAGTPVEHEIGNLLYTAGADGTTGVERLTLYAPVSEADARATNGLFAAVLERTAEQNPDSEFSQVMAGVRNLAGDTWDRAMDQYEFYLDEYGAMVERGLAQGRETFDAIQNGDAAEAQARIDEDQRMRCLDANGDGEITALDRAMWRGTDPNGPCAEYIPD